MNVDDSKIEKPQLDPLRLSSVSGDTHFDIENESLIGREVECTMTLPSPHISRYHAKLTVSDGGIFIEDLNSANGTFVNGKRISEKTKITLGDELRFDDLAYRLTSRESGTSDATVVLSNKAVLDAVQKQQSQDQSATSNAPSATPPKPVVAEQAAAQPEEDGTRILSSEQLKQAAHVHQQSQAFTDSGSGPRFVATTAPIRGQVFQLAASGADNTWKLGRSKECEICVPAPSVSRLHCEIRKEDGRFHIRATDESKPFMFNKLPQTTAMLKHNDHLQIGSIELIFRLDEVSEPSSRATQSEENYPMTSRIIALIAFGLFSLALLAVVITVQSSKDEGLLSLRDKPVKEASIEIESPEIQTDDSNFVAPKPLAPEPISSESSPLDSETRAFSNDNED